ncbi:DUF1508 domain-containing protein [Salinigranum sp. GCM10025319]|uniref:DUF1508 domain-containing protein n=1 Tax=Salinigranum sp. GCM10025319 TaxID=3252687 RepID=UPI0036150CCF
MASKQGRMGGIYREYVDEPSDPADVYGYWLYLFAYVLGLLGFVVYLGGIRLAPDAVLVVREATTVLIGIGAILMLLGIVLQLPINRLGFTAALAGALVGIAAIAGFVMVYPQGWGQSGVGVSSVLIFLYGVGFLVVSGATALVPVVTGKRGLFSESASRAAASVTPGANRTEEVAIETETADTSPDEAELETASEPDQPVDSGDDAGGTPAALVTSTGVFDGSNTNGAIFAMFRHNGQWAWWLVELAAVANSARLFDSKESVRNGVASVREKVATAGLLEIKHAAFRIYSEDDSWRWWLVREDGSIIAESERQFDERSAAEDAVSLVKEEGATATLVDIDGASFTLSESERGWTWALVDEERETLASDRTVYDSREATDTAVETVRAAMERAALVDLRDGGFEAFEVDEGGEWRWRFVDTTDTPTVEGVPAYRSRDEVESAIESFTDALEEPTVTNGTVPTFEVYADNDEWGWRLVDPDDTVRAVPATSLDTVDTATSDIDRIQSTFGTAPVFDLEDAAFEVFQATDGWRWRLVDTARATIATSTDEYGSEEECDAAVDRVRGLVEGADLLEFENAAFQLYEDDGNWRWRLIAEDGHVIADSGEQYTTRGDAASAIPRLKQNVPNAELLEIENAAFELYRADDEWRWRLIDETGANLATSGDSHPSRAAARTALETMRSYGPIAPTWAVHSPFVQVFERDETWHWRFVDIDGTVLAREAAAFDSRDGAHAAVTDVTELVEGSAAHEIGAAFIQIDRRGDRWLWRLRDRSRDVLGRTTQTWDDEDATRADAIEFAEGAPLAAVFDLEQPVFRVDSVEGGWRWQLVTADRTVLAESPAVYPDRDAVQSSVREVRRSVADAVTIESGPLSYELVREDDGWRWRLVADEGVVARDADTRNTREGAQSALQVVKNVVDRASILEIENAAFELHEGPGGWHWRLIDENGETISRSISDYETRRTARNSLESIKRNAPTAGETIDD